MPRLERHGDFDVLPAGSRRYSRGTPTPSDNALQWTSRPTRFYGLDYRPSFSPGTNWAELMTLPWLGAENAGFDDYGNRQFYRVRAFRPLMP